jgi:hypothetical protein
MRTSSFFLARHARRTDEMSLRTAWYRKSFGQGSTLPSFVQGINLRIIILVEIQIVQSRSRLENLQSEPHISKQVS